MSRFLVVLLLVALLMPVGAVAQEGDSPAPVEVPESPEEPKEPIDGVTALVSAEYRGASGNMVLVLDSKVQQRVTLVDAGAVLEGGEIARQSFTLQRGENKIRMPATKIQGKAVVTISTRNVLYAVVVQVDSNLITGPYDSQDVQLGALAGLSAGLAVTSVIAIRRVRGVGDSPERLL